MNSLDEHLVKGVGVYAGTFDPITNGHFDIIKRAAHVFDKLIVAVADVGKPGLLFSLEERIAMVRESVDLWGEPAVHVCGFGGLLVKFVRSVGARVVVRGLRAVSDYEYESQMAMTNRQLDSDIETFFIMTSKEYSFISSSIVKEVARHGGDYSDFVPGHVVAKLEKAFGRS